MFGENMREPHDPESWKIAGFDCVEEPDRLVFRPNNDRSREPAIQLLAMTGFLCLMATPFLFILRIAATESSSEQANRFGSVTVTGLFLLVFVAAAGLCLYWFYRDSVRDRFTPLVLDRRRDCLSHGDRIICPLSSIRCVLLHRIDPSTNSENKASVLSRYGVSVLLHDYRTIPHPMLSGSPFLRYGLGPQEREVEREIQKVASFIGAGFRLSSESSESAGGSMGESV